MGQEAKFGTEDPSISKKKIKDPSCLESLLKCCCCCSCSSERDAPSDNNPPVPNKQLPPRGSTVPKDEDQSKKDDEKIFEPATRTRPKTDQERAPAPAIQAPKTEKEDERLASRGSIKTEGELKPSDTGKTHGKDALGSSQATRAQIEKEREDKHPSSHGSVLKPKDDLKPADTGKIHGKGFDYDNSLVSPQATKANPQMSKKEREDEEGEKKESPPTQGDRPAKEKWTPSPLAILL